MRLTRAKYHNKCGDCRATIKRGDVIGFSGRTVICEECATQHHDDARADVENGGDQDERDWPPSASVLASDRRLAARGLTVVRFSSGAVMTQNSRGRCEDAPCCGCCS